MTIDTELIPFHGDQLVYVEQDGVPFVAVKPICERLGLAWQSQLRRLSAEKERWGITIRYIPSAGGEQETTCLPLNRLAAWLFSIQVSKVREELREPLTRYQIEAADVLDRHFRGKRERDADEIAILREQLTRSHGHLLAAIPRWAKMKLLHDAGFWWSTVKLRLKLSDPAFMDLLLEMQRCGVMPMGDWQAGDSEGWFERLKSLGHQNWLLREAITKAKQEADKLLPRASKKADGPASDAEGNANA